jgi:hypothetical protein
MRLGIQNLYPMLSLGYEATYLKVVRGDDHAEKTRIQRFLDPAEGL